MSFLSEFKEFALKGNVMDLAVGVIIGGAFGKIVESLVGNIIMPIVGLAGGSPDFKGIVLGPIKVGSFIQTVVDFTILAFCIFLMIKAMNMARKRFEKPAEPAAPPAPPASEVYLKEIRDALVAKN
ncbi:MAG: large conductance mechanosensitive channel protein MscL [Hyphomicrobiaceae bacterium]